MPLPRDQWKLDAACYESYDERFMGTPEQQDEVRREYCIECRVIDECGQYAKDTRMKIGVWGGRKLGRRPL